MLAEPDGEAFAAALAALLRDAAERERLRAAGLARAAAFSWDATARAVDALLSDAGASRVCRNAVSDGALTSWPLRMRRSPDQPNELGPCSADSHVYQ